MLEETTTAFTSYALQGQNQKSLRAPFQHQMEALQKLSSWFVSDPVDPKGGILVLPTGGGKTFTAVRFLCEKPLSQGHKVIWLAHTHHLLDQASLEFGKHLACLRNCSSLNVRIVSGSQEHYDVRDIKPSDDVVITTLQALTYAAKHKHPAWRSFLKAARDDLTVVFDEAHHAGAPTYRELLNGLRVAKPEMVLLGLTATPRRTDDQDGRSILSTIFPQRVLYEVSLTKLIGQRVLAEPHLRDVHTDLDAEFDDELYSEWQRKGGDLPERVVDHLAKNASRNGLIVEHFVKHRDDYGKTIIFADRWFQCEALARMLKIRDIPDVFTVFTRVERGYSLQDENDRQIEAFRKSKNGVLINIRIATEGSDFPDVQTIFLTRQTTSAILLMQMVGRGLRGPKVGGTKRANIVSFIDNWKHLISWAGFGALSEGGEPPPVKPLGVRPEYILISTHLIDRLVEQLYRPVSDAPDFLTLLPIGWYVTDYVSLAQTPDGVGDFRETDSESRQQIILVFEGEKKAYESLFRELRKEDLTDFESDALTLHALPEELVGWLADRAAKSFSECEPRSLQDMRTNLLHIARHLAQNGEAPQFYDFAARNEHNLKVIANRHVNGSVSDLDKFRELLREYRRDDRFWRAFYPTFEQLKAQYDICVNQVIREMLGITTGSDPEPKGSRGHRIGPLPDDLVERVKHRDGYQCLCCGETDRRYLQADHVQPRYLGGKDTIDNLQTLCAKCNGAKGVEEAMDFRLSCSPLTRPAESLRVLPPGRGSSTASGIRYLRRLINCFYQCNAVAKITYRKNSWRLELASENEARWLDDHIDGLYDAVFLVCGEPPVLVVSDKGGYQLQWPRNEQ